MEKQTPDPAPLFIVGCERSGTTMLQRLFNRHPEMWIPRDETRFFPLLFPRFRRLIEADRIVDAVNLVSGVSLVQRWGVQAEVSDLVSTDTRRAYGEVIGGVMMRKAMAEGKVRWGEKTPTYVYSVDLLLEMFPDCRFLYVVRDGRDVSLSLTQLAWGPSNAYGAAHHWVNVHREWKSVRAKIGDRALEIRYEDFLENPNKVVDQIGFLIEQNDLSKCLETFDVKGGNSNKWKNKFFFSEKEQLVFDAVAGPELVELGYKERVQNAELPFLRKLLWRVDDFWRRTTNRILRRHSGDELPSSG